MQGEAGSRAQALKSANMAFLLAPLLTTCVTRASDLPSSCAFSDLLTYKHGNTKNACL